MMLMDNVGQAGELPGFMEESLRGEPHRLTLDPSLLPPLLEHLLDRSDGCLRRLCLDAGLVVRLAVILQAEDFLRRHTGEDVVEQLLRNNGEGPRWI